MKKIILISQTEPKVMEKLQKEFFTDDLDGKTFAYMPCEGNHPDNSEYTPFWKQLVENKNGIFKFIDNSKHKKVSEGERLFVEKADYLMVPGGNTFHLLNNLRNSGLFDSIKRFFEKENYCYLGMSAGAVILGPTIQNTGRSGFSSGRDLNDVGLTDLTALNIIGFEAAVHFDPKKDQEALETYKQTTKYEVRPIKNDEVIIITK